jgi:hypothetical protein
MLPIIKTSKIALLRAAQWMNQIFDQNSPLNSTLTNFNFKGEEVALVDDLEQETDESEENK